MRRKVCAELFQGAGPWPQFLRLWMLAPVLGQESQSVALIGQATQLASAGGWGRQGGRGELESTAPQQQC